MKHTRTRLYLLVLPVLLLAATSANAQMVEHLMRGNTAVVVPGITTAWEMNPAALSGVGAIGGRHALSADIELSGDTDMFALNWAGAFGGGNSGLGAGYHDFAYGKQYGFGYGAMWPRNQLAWGATIGWTDPDVGDSDSYINIGVIGGTAIGGRHAARSQWGAVARDLTDSVVFDIGLAFDLGGGTLLAVDLRDLGDRYDRTVNLGGSRKLGRAQEWTAGVGVADGDLTFGAMRELRDATWRGGSWKVGAAFVDSDLIIGAFGTFGH